MKASDFISAFGKTLKSLIKAIVLSRPVGRLPKCSKPSDTIIILGNGPSLNSTISSSGRLLEENPTMAVNFMANTDEFFKIRPDYYVIADPHFFNAFDQENVSTLWKNLASVDWPMVLLVPAKMVGKTKKVLCGRKNISVKGFNFVGIEGYKWFECFMFRHRIGMPRPRNVLVPALMSAISAGYKEILLAGADHSWLETLRVTDENHVVSVQPHFYADSKKELKRSETEYRSLHLHDVLYSFYVAFKSYHIIELYATKRGVCIYNITPGSYIDAFPRKKI